MKKLNSLAVALTFGVVIAGFHLVWSLLVALGWAQSLLDFIFQVHMIAPVLTVMPFSFGMAISLLILTGAIGFIVGYFFSFVWNQFHKHK